MRLKTLFICALCLLALASCRSHNHGIEDDDITCCPHCVLIIQPYDGISSAEAKRFSQQLSEKVATLTPVVVSRVEVRPAAPLTADLLNDQHTRYRADKILKRQDSELQHADEVIVGITASDISTSLGDKADWGIQGLAFTGSNTCVVSTFRLTNKRDLWKLGLHEFIHAYFNASHCRNNDPHCIMQSAHGKPRWDLKSTLCAACALHCG